MHALAATISSPLLNWRLVVSYLVALPCMFAVYFYSRKLDLPGSYFATVLLLLLVILQASDLIVPGADAIVAMCLTMGLLNAANWYIDQQLTTAIKEGLVEVPPPPPVSQFCTTQAHDFAVGTKESTRAIQIINDEEWPTLLKILESFSSIDRQGFYANLNYGDIKPRAALNFVNDYPDNSDAHILYGHVKLCIAKAKGLIPGIIPDESTANAVAQAFKHFRLALRSDKDDVEAYCGLIIAKGFIALNDEHIEDTLKKLLILDPLHFHGAMSAARFLIRSPQSANRFIAVVEDCVGAEDVTVAISRVLAHVECLGFSKQSVTDSRVVADLYVQLKVYEKACQSLGSWQRGIAGNLVAYAFEMIGDDDEKARQLSELNGVVSPYPWKRKRNSDEVIFGVLAG